MLVSYDTEAGATYVELAQGRVARTLHIDDLVMVDLDGAGRMLGVEFVVPPDRVTDAMLQRVAERFPQFTPMAADRAWLLTHA